jgi:hypothetical protein
MFLLDHEPHPEMGAWCPADQWPFLPTGKRWTPADGSPVLIQLDAENADRALLKSPERYKPA